MGSKWLMDDVQGNTTKRKMRRQNLIESGRRFRILYRSARFQHQQNQNLRNLNIKGNLSLLLDSEEVLIGRLPIMNGIHYFPSILDIHLLYLF
jgi:hypothetical protein